MIRTKLICSGVVGALLMLGCGGSGSNNDEGTGGAGGSAGSGMGGTSMAGAGGSTGGAGGSTGGAGGSTGGAGGTGGTGMTTCPAIPDRTMVDVDQDEITADTTWTCDNNYILKTKTFIVGGATLTVEAGVQVYGDQGGALISTTQGRLVTNGTADAPVVFTSVKADGQRAAGDWSGVVLLGKAPINVAGGTNAIEGLPASEDRGQYGGTDSNHDCGSLKYTRIEFVGEVIGVDNELNGISLGACGSATTLSYVQVHKGLDDGIEFFSGSPKLDHVVISATDDDSFDWDEGFTGQAQFVMVVQNQPTGSDRGMETDNQGDAHDAMPRSMPTLYNLTLVGGEGIGWVAREGTWGKVYNAIFTGFQGGAIDVRDPATAAGATNSPPDLLAENSLFFNNGAADFVDEPAGGMEDDDGGFDENAFFTDAARNNKFEDPQLPDTSPTSPNLVPPAGSPAATGGATPGAGFDASATYIGAFEPGGTNWADGWTAFPEN